MVNKLGLGQPLYYGLLEFIILCKWRRFAMNSSGI